ncbi:MAG: type II CRISPR-associated endonuclease Cas1 [Prevotella sp.]|nr:type II CRISPR-associated endonuclease Cas1 [Prevotella sp.]
MAKQTLVFESAKDLSLSDGMIVITDKDTGEITLRSLEDVQMIMVDNHSVRITIPLMTRLVKNNVSIVICDERHMPVSMMMDLESNTLQSKRFQCQLAATIPSKKQLWKQIVEAKIRNQSLLLEKLGKGKNLLAQYYNNVKSGDSTNREGIAAKMYWKLLMGKEFIRDRYGDSPNDMLNYGYTLLRSMMARHLMNAGLLPTVGVFHRNCYNAFPLADDMMEPYRPFVDYKVKDMFEHGITGVCRESKKTLLGLFYSDIPANAMMMSASTLAGVYEGMNKLIVFPRLQ